MEVKVRVSQTPSQKADAVAARAALAFAAYYWTENHDQQLVAAQNAETGDWRAGGMVTIPSGWFSEPVAFVPDWLEFEGYAKRWKASRKITSSFSKDLVANTDYLDIIGMGLRAVPCILWQLHSELQRGEPDHWFVALLATAKVNPVPEESHGKIFEMANAWIEWGKQTGLLNADLGVSIPKSW